MKPSLLAVAIFLALSHLSFAAEAPLAPQLKNDLVALEGKRVHRFDDAPLANAKYFAVYYSASWCGPCKLFTPKLVEFYNRTKPAHPEFELILVSSDYTEPDMEAYMKTDAMPWPALDFRKGATGKHVLTSYRGRGIPCLVFLDANGKVLSHSYVGTSYVGPGKVMADIEKTLGSATAASPASTAPTATATAPATGTIKPVSPKGSNFDEFFKKNAQ